jgi:hypothetical protein
MSARASVPAAELRSALAKGGWRVESVHEGGAWWCREWWQLRSSWSPQDTEAYISFLVDPQDRSQMPWIWALRASAKPPAQQLDAEGEHTLSQQELAARTPDAYSVPWQAKDRCAV